MIRDWESQFREWAKPPGKTEEARCTNAVSAIRNAIDADKTLQRRNITVFVQGSYRNNTNVKRDSDIDIGILCNDSFFHYLPDGISREQMGFTDASYRYEQYRNDVENALKNYFGKNAVARGNKALDLHETSYHVEADVVPFFEYRHYNIDKSYSEGVRMNTDDEKIITNWPEQHYENGCAKNNSTGKRYKSIVRVLKALSNEMTEAKIQGGNLPGFLIECLTWNAPNTCFGSASYVTDVKSTIIYLFEQTRNDATCKEWTEVSERKFLFGGNQKWTREQTNSFAVALWKYAELKGQS